MHRPVILSLRENEKTPTMVTWSGSNSGRLNPPSVPPRLALCAKARGPQEHGANGVALRSFTLAL